MKVSTSRELVSSLGDDLPVTILFDYQPYEKPTLEYPGYHESVVVEAVMINEVDVIELLSRCAVKGLEEKCLTSIHEEGP